MAVGLRGVVPIIPTAFDGDGRVDLPATGRLVEFAVACGAHAVA
ncbi:MAG: dihydrodipicolinate synthase family protein, partial [Armatimonadetes bacterium]|nr:dihydrodipicolinate synthase family protein [Armatimonadota bacterium]